MFSGKASFDEVRDRLHVEIEPEGFETVGGYVLTRVGRVPAAGETFELDGLVVEVVERSAAASTASRFAAPRRWRPSKRSRRARATSYG